MNDMSRKSGRQRPDDAWLTDEQQRAWQAWMRVMLRLQYEMNRQLQDDAGLTLADYDVLVALSNAGGRLQLSDLAATVGWERSRLSHHLLRMGKRGLSTGAFRKRRPGHRRRPDIRRPAGHHPSRLGARRPGT